VSTGYVFMAWYLVKPRDNFTLRLTHLNRKGNGETPKPYGYKDTRKP